MVRQDSETSQCSRVPMIEAAVYMRADGAVCVCVGGVATVVTGKRIGTSGGEQRDPAAENRQVLSEDARATVWFLSNPHPTPHPQQSQKRCRGREAGPL